MNDLHDILDLPRIAPNGRPAALHFGGRGRGPSEADMRKERERAKKQEQKFMRELQKSLDQPIHIPPPPPPPPPAPTRAASEVEQAEQDKRRQAAQRKGMRSTLLAGETGGYAGSTPMGGAKTLLG